MTDVREVFVNEFPDIPEIKQLNEKYKLDKVVSEAKNEFEKIIKLRSWVQQCWTEHGYDQIPDKNNSLKILEAAAQGKNFQCWYYATVFIQSAISLGFKARRLSIGINPVFFDHRPGNNGHIVAEIWSSQFNKWVVMDPDMNAHYEKDGIPLNGLEIHNAWVRQELGNIKYVQGKPVPAMIGKRSIQERASEFVFGAYNVMDYYFRLQIEMRNNWFSSEERAKPFAAVAWIDRWNSSYKEKKGKIIDDIYWTDVVQDIYWNEN